MNIIVNDYSVFEPLKEESDIERCGVMLGIFENDGSPRLYRLAEMRNLHWEPWKSFRITQYQIHRLMKRTPFIALGFWHTHNNGHDIGPSETDLRTIGEKYPRHIGMVFHQPTGTVTWFQRSQIIKEEVV